MIPTLRRHEPDGGKSAFVVALLLFLTSSPYLIADLQTFILLDDGNYVYRNPAVLQGLSWSGCRWAFTTFSWSNWHPLTWLSHMLDASLFGSAAWGHHLTSVLLHALNTALLFLALKRLTGALWGSGFAAAFFGMHPLRVESVAWIAERKDVLSGFFFMLVLLAYERYARRGGGGRYLAVAGLLALGLLAKPMLVTAPLVLLLLDFWPLGRLRPGAGSTKRPGIGPLAEKIPLLVLCASSSAITYLAQQQSGAVAALRLLSFFERLVHALVAYTGYLGKTLWPSSLALYYPHPFTTPPGSTAAGAFLTLALISFCATLLSRSRPYLAVGWLWFLGMLVPVIGLVQVGSQALADRYSYLPAVGLGLLLTWGAPEVFRRLRLRSATATAAILLVLGALSAATVVQAGRWRDSETLFRHTLSVTSGNWLIHYSLGFLLDDQGRRVEAIEEFQKALRVRPDYPDALFSLGRAFHVIGRFEEAVACYQKAVRLKPDLLEAHENLSMILYILGRRDEAESQRGEVYRIRAQRGRSGG